MRDVFYFDNALGFSEQSPGLCQFSKANGHFFHSVNLMQSY